MPHPTRLVLDLVKKNNIKSNNWEISLGLELKITKLYSLNKTLNNPLLYIKPKIDDSLIFIILLDNCFDE
jgi:hypothetical protein